MYLYVYVQYQYLNLFQIKHDVQYIMLELLKSWTLLRLSLWVFLLTLQETCKATGMANTAHILRQRSSEFVFFGGMSFPGEVKLCILLLNLHGNEKWNVNYPPWN